VQVEVPLEWAPIVADAFDNTNRSVILQYYDTQLVASAEPRDPRLGPAPFPQVRGNLSAAVQDFLRAGVTELWPDWERSDINGTVRLGQQPQARGPAGLRCCSAVGTVGGRTWLKQHAAPRLHVAKVQRPTGDASNPVIAASQS